MEEITLTKQQVQIMLQYLRKSANVVNNLIAKNLDLYFECCENTGDITVGPVEFGQFILELEEKLK